MQKFDYIYSKSFAMELQCFHKGIKLGFVLKLTRHKKSVLTSKFLEGTKAADLILYIICQFYLCSCQFVGHTTLLDLELDLFIHFILYIIFFRFSFLTFKKII